MIPCPCASGTHRPRTSLSRAKMPRVEPMLSIAFALDSMRPDQIARAEADTGSDQAMLFRRWALSRPLPSLWGYRAMLPGVRNASELAPRDPARLRALFAMNDDAALLALRSGDYASAAERARESLAASRHLLEEPRMPDALMGVRFARRAAQLIAAAAQRTGDHTLFAQASRLDADASQSDVSILKWVVQQEANPDSKAALSISSNKLLMPGLRVEVMHPIAMGGCRNIREVVFGFSDARRVALGTVAQSISDIPRANELAVALRTAVCGHVSPRAGAGRPTSRERQRQAAHQGRAGLDRATVRSRAH